MPYAKGAVIGWVVVLLLVGGGVFAGVLLSNGSEQTPSANATTTEQTGSSDTHVTPSNVSSDTRTVDTNAPMPLENVYQSDISTSRSGKRFVVTHYSFENEYVVQSNGSDHSITPDANKLFAFLNVSVRNAGNGSYSAPLVRSKVYATSELWEDADAKYTQLQSQDIPDALSRYTPDTELQPGERESGWAVLEVSRDFQLTDIMIGAQDIGFVGFAENTRCFGAIHTCV